MVQPRDFRRIHQTAIRHEFQARFSEEAHGIEIEERGIDLPVEEVEPEVLRRMVAGDGPSIALLRQTFGRFLRDHDLVQPMTGEVVRDFAAQWHPRIAQACRWPRAVDGNADGGFQMVPASYSLSAMFCHRRSLSACGRDTNAPPTDWDQLLALVQEVAAAVGGPALWFPDWEAASWWLFQLIHDSYAAPAGTERELSAIDWAGDAARRGIAMFHKMFFEQRLAAVYDGPASVFASRLLSGGAPIVFGTSLGATVASRPDEFALWPTPAGPSGRSLCQLNVVGWYANAALDASQLDAVERYLAALQRWIHLADGGERLQQAGVAPSLTSWLADAASDRYVAAGCDAWRAALAGLLDTSCLEAPGADVEKIAVSKALHELFASGEQVGPDQLFDHCGLAARGSALGAAVMPGMML